MTELERRAEEYATYTNPENGEKSLDWDLFNSLIKFTTKETELLSKHIVELQKTNGSLTDRVNEASEIIKDLLDILFINDCAMPSELKERAEQFLGVAK